MVGRLQIFNNWSPWLVAEPDRRSGLVSNISATRPTTCGSMPDDEIDEVRHWRGREDRHPEADDVLDSHVVRVPRPIRPTSAPTIASTRFATSLTASRICFWSAATACTNTTIRITPC